MSTTIILCHGRTSLMPRATDAILLAGGNGSRLQPFTFYTSKHLLPIDNVPMIFYPLKNLQLIGMKRVYIIVNAEHLVQWNGLLAKYDFEMEINIDDESFKDKYIFKEDEVDLRL